LQVRFFDEIAVNQSEVADPGAGQRFRLHRAERAERPEERR